MAPVSIRGLARGESSDRLERENNKGELSRSDSVLSTSQWFVKSMIGGFGSLVTQVSAAGRAQCEDWLRFYARRLQPCPFISFGTSRMPSIGGHFQVLQLTSNQCCTAILTIL